MCVRIPGSFGVCVRCVLISVYQVSCPLRKRREMRKKKKEMKEKWREGNEGKNRKRLWERHTHTRTCLCEPHAEAHEMKKLTQTFRWNTTLATCFCFWAFTSPLLRHSLHPSITALPSICSLSIYHLSFTKSKFVFWADSPFIIQAPPCCVKGRI